MRGQPKTGSLSWKRELAGVDTKVESLRQAEAVLQHRFSSVEAKLAQASPRPVPHPVVNVPSDPVGERAWPSLAIDLSPSPAAEAIPPEILRVGGGARLARHSVAQVVPRAYPTDQGSELRGGGSEPEVGSTLVGVRTLGVKLPQVLNPILTEILKGQPKKVFSGKPTDFAAWKRSWDAFAETLKASSGGNPIPDKAMLRILEGWTTRPKKYSRQGWKPHQICRTRNS